MEDRETPRMLKCGESKTTRIMMATVPHVTSGSGLRKFQSDGFLLDRVYLCQLWAVGKLRSSWMCFMGTFRDMVSAANIPHWGVVGLPRLLLTFLRS